MILRVFCLVCAAAQNEMRTTTIDRDFDEYFAKLML